MNALAVDTGKVAVDDIQAVESLFSRKSVIDSNESCGEYLTTL